MSEKENVVPKKYLPKIFLRSSTNLALLLIRGLYVQFLISSYVQLWLQFINSILRKDCLISKTSTVSIIGINLYNFLLPFPCVSGENRRIIRRITTIKEGKEIGSIPGRQ